MGHKVHPYGFRIGIIKPWLAKWYADRDYATLLQEDMRIRELVAKQLSNASVSQVEIERGINHVTVTVHTAKPGIVIGKGGANVEALRTNVGKLTNKKVKLEIKEILQPELDGMLLAQNVAGQLERRIAFRKAIKQSIQRTIKAGAKGVKIQVSGRLGGSEMSRTEWDKEGRIPLGTLRADISYGVVHAHTTYGRIGVKAWVYRGEQLGERPGSARTEPRAPRRGAAGTRTRSTGRTNGAATPSEAPAPEALEQASATQAPSEAPKAEPKRTARSKAPAAAEVETPAAADDATAEAPKAEAVKAEAPKAESPKADEPKADETKAKAKTETAKPARASKAKAKAKASEAASADEPAKDAGETTDASAGDEPPAKES
ncbi:MAG: 30S ribosomal protein S3 [Chloroflexi bacterium]|nr:30S ribosomal protein S3 [Chloroflexota bacterium]